MTDRYLPDKAIDLLDEAGSRARISAYTARQGTNGSRSTEMDTGPDLELQQVLETKATCIQVDFCPHIPHNVGLSLSLVQGTIVIRPIDEGLLHCK